MKNAREVCRRGCEEGEVCRRRERGVQKEREVCRRGRCAGGEREVCKRRERCAGGGDVQEKGGVQEEKVS